MNRRETELLMLDESASRSEAIQSRKLDLVADAVVKQFAENHALKEVHILPLSGKFSVYFFFWRTEHLMAAKNGGVFKKIMDAFYAEMDRMGRGRREDLEVHFEWDSDENVLKKYGSYQFYFRK